MLLDQFYLLQIKFTVLYNLKNHFKYIFLVQLEFLKIKIRNLNLQGVVPIRVVVCLVFPLSLRPITKRINFSYFQNKSDLAKQK